MSIKKLYYKCICIAFVAMGISCKKPYLPPTITAPNTYLVIDGVINTGNDSTFIYLSRTGNIKDTVKRSGEHGATVTIEGGTGPYNLAEIRSGVYAAPGLNLDISKTYKLRIKTGGEEYLSDEITAKDSPPIDDVNFEAQGNTLQINVSTHDPSNSSKYYKWDYEDAWRFHTKYRSGFIYDATLKQGAGDLRFRTSEEEIYTCYNSGISSTINIASTVKLSGDVVNKEIIARIPSTSLKINDRYSILVKQYVLTKEAYQFWENLKKNTEQLGSIFDPLPSEIGGNIHNINNPAEPVIGFVSAAKVQTKRIYINKEQLPNWATAYPSTCVLDSTLYARPMIGNEVKLFLFPPNNALAIFSIENDRAEIIGYTRADQECADCRLFGRKKAPVFWKEK